MRYIELPRGRRTELAQKHGVSTMGVWKALHFRSNGRKAKAIREDALRTDGRIVNIIKAPDGFIPNCSIKYQRGDHGKVIGWVQHFPGGICLTVDTLDNSIMLVKDGEAVAHFEKATLNDWSCAAFMADSLAVEVGGQEVNL